MNDYLFKLLCNVSHSSKSRVVIRAYESERRSDSHTYIDIEVRFQGSVIFPKGNLYVGIPNGTTIDGIYAKDAVLACVAMRPGDTDPDYFDDYTPAQLSFATTYGEELSLIREYRYCDPETGF